MFPVFPSVHGAERDTKFSGKLFLGQSSRVADLFDEKGKIDRRDHE